MKPKRPIIGIQVHHSVFLHDAMRGIINARAGLMSARTRRGEDPLLIELEKRTSELARDISQAQLASAERLRSLPLDVLKHCRDGHGPYPDEPTAWEA